MVLLLSVGNAKHDMFFNEPRNHKVQVALKELLSKAFHWQVLNELEDRFVKKDYAHCDDI